MKQKLFGGHILGLALASSTLIADPMFHIKNKSNGTIQIDISQKGKSLTGLVAIAKDKDFGYDLDTSKQTRLELSYCPTASACKTKSPDKLVATFAINKTIYIKFDGKKIVPQDGKGGNTYPLKYSLADNVERENIMTKQGTK